MMLAMLTERRRARVLLVRAWTNDPAVVIEQLYAAGVEPELTRVDFEAALHAALTKDRFDLVVHDEAALSRDQIDAALRECAHAPPIVKIEPFASLAARVADALRARRH